MKLLKFLRSLFTPKPAPRVHRICMVCLGPILRNHHWTAKPDGIKHHICCSSPVMASVARPSEIGAPSTPDEPATAAEGYSALAQVIQNTNSN